jgi:hypothetical protein
MLTFRETIPRCERNQRGDDRECSFEKALMTSLHYFCPELSEHLPPVRAQGWFPALVICRGASTRIAHSTEQDHTYTLIQCPPQEGLEYDTDSGAFFHFYLPTEWFLMMRASSAGILLMMLLLSRASSRFR